FPTPGFLRSAAFPSSHAPCAVEKEPTGEQSRRNAERGKIGNSGKRGGRIPPATGSRTPAPGRRHAMIQQGRGPRRWAACLLAVGVMNLSGCLCYLHPIPPAPLAYTQACHVAPKCARDHVYVFFVHGMDPFDYANMTGVRDYVQELGFHKTYYGQLYHTAHFEREIRRIHNEDPDAHFVLLGFRFGTNMVRSIAQAVKEDGIHIDLLVYCGANTLHNNDRDQPDNCGRILNILAWGFIWNGDTMSRAENIDVPDVWHFGSPSHPK